MKKMIAPLFAALLLFCSCGDVYRTYETYEVVRPGVEMFTDYIDAMGRDWKIDGAEGKPGCYVYQEFKFPEVNKAVLDKGAVLVYLVDASGRDNILPYVYPVKNESGQKLMQNIRFDVDEGMITLVVEWEDFKIYRLDDFRFKVCILSQGTAK